MLNKKNKFKLILLSSLILIFCGCNSQPNVNIPPKPDYSNSEFWFENLNIESDKEVDIFYVYPTVTLGGKDDNGNDIYFADITKPEVRNEAYSNQNYNKNVYAADEYNFYAPFYRQISFNVYGLDEKTFKECFQIAVQDVIDAFKYYMENLNNGRPYFLLGHSQGSSMLIELLKHGISDDEFQNMIAAYTIGYSISEADINKYSNRLIPAQDSCDLNCIILFNSLTTIDAISPTIPISDIGINPVIWTTETTFAPRELHLGYSLYDKTQNQYVITPNATGVYLKDNYLICTDIDPYQCYQEDFKESFPLGNLHFMDSWLYSENLRLNMACRVRFFR